MDQRELKKRGWYATGIGVLVSLLFAAGIYILTKSAAVTILFGLGIFGLAYFIVVGLTMVSNALYVLLNRDEAQNKK